MYVICSFLFLHFALFSEHQAGSGIHRIDRMITFDQELFHGALTCMNGFEQPVC